MGWREGMGKGSDEKGWTGEEKRWVEEEWGKGIDREGN